MMTDNIRAALERLVELDKSSPNLDCRWAFKHENAIADAIEALEAEVVGEGPTDEAIISQASKFLAYSDAHMGDPAAWEGSDADLLAFARAAIARWGRPTAPPAPEAGEVGELVEWLEAQAIVYEDYLQSRSGSKRLTRAATLLQQQAPPAPIVPPKEENREFVLKEMTAEDGSSLGWYVNHSDFYCDIQKEDGVWGIYFRDKITDQDAYGEPNETND